MNNTLKTLLFLPFFPLYYFRYKNLKREFPKVMDTETTLLDIKKKGKSIVRYGDGELNIISGKKIGFQDSDFLLAKRLRDILVSNSDNCMVAIPDVFNGLRRFKLDAKSFWLFSIVKNWSSWKGFFGKNLYGDSLCSRFYMDLKNSENSEHVVKLWKKIWDKRDIVIIEGENTKMGIGNDLFSNSKSISRIICPAKNAFLSYNTILLEAQKINKDTLILIALGPTATVLAYDLSGEGFQALDIGHLDVEYCWLKMKAKNKIPIAGRFVNEVSNKDIDQITDNSYESQIICKIDSTNHP